MQKPATLSSSLVAIKGKAAPSVSQDEPQAAPAGGQHYWKAMTLKLDRERFVRLKQMGLEQNKTSQALLIEAVDLLLENK